MNQVTHFLATSPDRQSKLNELGWRIVDMARADGPRSLNPDGVWPSLARKLFGISAPQRLASDTLEELRRFCVRAWYWSHVRPSDLGRLIDCGYSRADALQILEHIAASRGCMPSVQDNLLSIGSGLETSIASHRRSSSVRAPSAPTSASPAEERGQSPRDGWQPCPCR